MWCTEKTDSKLKKQCGPHGIRLEYETVARMHKHPVEV